MEPTSNLYQCFRKSIRKPGETTLLKWWKLNILYSLPIYLCPRDKKIIHFVYIVRLPRMRLCPVSPHKIIQQPKLNGGIHFPYITHAKTTPVFRYFTSTLLTPEQQKIRKRIVYDINSRNQNHSPNLDRAIPTIY